MCGELGNKVTNSPPGPWPLAPPITLAHLPSEAPTIPPPGPISNSGFQRSQARTSGKLLREAYKVVLVPDVFPPPPARAGITNRSRSIRHVQGVVVTSTHQEVVRERCWCCKRSREGVLKTLGQLGRGVGHGLRRQRGRPDSIPAARADFTCLSTYFQTNYEYICSSSCPEGPPYSSPCLPGFGPISGIYSHN